MLSLTTLLFPSSADLFIDEVTVEGKELLLQAYSMIETTVDALGQELEHHHQRLDEGVRRYGEEESEA